MDSTSNASIKEDAVSKILGKDRNGRVRGMGRGITATKLAFLQARDAHVQKLEANQAQLVSEIEDLKNLVKNIASQKQDGGSKSDTTDISNGGPRCQLLDWFSEEEVVIGEGELCSVEASYKIGRIPLGPNAAAVVVNSASDKDASVWRPTPTITSLGQAVGAKIAWPFDKIILDDLETTTQNKTAGSSATNASDNRIMIIAWHLDDKVVAEGYLSSTDPKELVNCIPLGPNAASVKIDKVIDKAAYLWRPREDMIVMEDALFATIAWPIDKLQYVNKMPSEDAVYKKTSESKEASVWKGKGVGPSVSKFPSTTKGSSSKSVSNSSNSNSSGKKNCFLLDCFGSGKKVAEGRVLSNNPTDKVHFVPLGANASKVMVEVCKIQDARVWRPNSEIVIIADALGSTVAWPNDKIVFK